MVAEYVMDTCIKIQPLDKNKQNTRNESVGNNLETCNTTESFEATYDYQYMQDDKGHNCCKKCV